MNFKGILTRIQTPKSVLEEQQAAIDKQTVEQQQREAELNTIHREWLQHPFSQILITTLQESQKSFNDKAELLALEQSNESNIPLIQSNTIKKVLNYVTRREAINSGAGNSSNSFNPRIQHVNRTVSERITN